MSMGNPLEGKGETSQPRIKMSSEEKSTSMVLLLNSDKKHFLSDEDVNIQTQKLYWHTPTVRIRASLTFSLKVQDGKRGWSWCLRLSEINHISWSLEEVWRNCGLPHLTASWPKSFTTHVRVHCMLYSPPNNLFYFLHKLQPYDFSCNMKEEYFTS